MIVYQFVELLRTQTAEFLFGSGSLWPTTGSVRFCLNSVRFPSLHFTHSFVRTISRDSQLFRALVKL